MAKRFIILLFIAAWLSGSASGQRDHPRGRSFDAESHPVKHPEEQQTQYWVDKAQEKLLSKLAEAETQTANTNKAKNVILFLGDGMSVHTVTATRNLLGDSAEQVYFEGFPYTGLSKTYCVNRQVADSACTATAYLGGVKGNYGTIGVNGQVPRYSCDGDAKEENQVLSIAQWAQAAGKDAGLVTTARVTHASPAGVYAHTADRNWENDWEVANRGCDPAQTIDIARQLVEQPVGQRLKVILGGGRQNFINTTVNDEEGLPGLRTDGRHLIRQWLDQKRAANESANYVWSRKGLGLVDLEHTDYLLGLFANSHLPYNGDRDRKRSQLADPSLSELTEAAIKVLSRNQEGFFLFVEGARIDMAHHDTYARRSLEDTAEFARAVQKAREMTAEDDTLIVVTADHAHVMSINGYPFRDQEITGLAQLADDNLPYTILSYANGPGYYSGYNRAEGRALLKEKTVADADFRYPTLAPLDAETHGGDDVAVYASGPYAQYFSGNYEQSNIPALMARAAGIGPYA
ncbi:LOW QUALITY PROTEIN: membrane-bound alkaline phosphatase [Drosophila gunungcola]|uniref:LOW QUALITY PROTEIN: membrane-bound alkaline phosphatase n=1 Tax=Drosophila gunungcola TaxID=103775 RepID=UPI0022E102D5|nr:LOW QUALITY PROTEIN: membrane-bound alkaline phosphatase [Drosophila gunungcola]